MGCPKRCRGHGVRGCRLAVLPAGSGPRTAIIASFLPLPGTNVLDQATDDVNEIRDGWMNFVRGGPVPGCDSTVARVQQGSPKSVGRGRRIEARSRMLGCKFFFLAGRRSSVRALWIGEDWGGREWKGRWRGVRRIVCGQQGAAPRVWLPVLEPRSGESPVGCTCCRNNRCRGCRGLGRGRSGACWGVSGEVVVCVGRERALRGGVMSLRNTVCPCAWGYRELTLAVGGLLCAHNCDELYWSGR